METKKLISDERTVRSERGVSFFRQLMRNKQETQAQIREQANNPEFWKAVDPLLKRNRERGNPFK